METEKEKTYISTNLKYLRNLKGKSLNDVANICDKTDVAVHYWENGTREPSAVDIAKLSNYFDISVDDLLNKDLRIKENYITQAKLDVLYSKTKDILSDDDRATIEFIMNKTIDNYEKSKNNEQ